MTWQVSMCRTTNIHTVTSCPQTNLESGLQQLHLAEDAAVLWLTAYIQWTHMRTSCHSTDSKMPHGCHHLLNNFGLHRILPILHNGPRDALKIAPSPAGNQGPHLVHCSFSSSQHPKWDLAQLTVVTDRHIYKPHYICSTAMRHASCALHTNAT